MISHRLDPLLRPRSMAIVGASTVTGSLGLFTAQQARISGFRGPIWAVNPKYSFVEQIACFPSIEALPEAPEHVVLAVSNSLVERELEKAVAAGAKSATIFASCYLPDDDSRIPLTERLKRICLDSGLLLCGGNCLGFFNLEDGVRSSWFPHPELPSGSIGLIAHSGSVFVTMTGLDRRLRFNHVVSAGQELAVTAADYLDFMVEQPSTRVVGLFLETVRDPYKFLAALTKARNLQIPVVVLKVGRTGKSAELARSHSGALAGDDAAYEAVFGHYGVTRVATLDEFSATLQLMAHPKRLVSGSGIVGIHDSGGQRGMAIDLAHDLDVPYAPVSPKTRQVLEGTLEYGLAPENPLDIWGTGKDFDNVFETCFGALLAEPEAAIGILFSDIGNGGVMDLPWAEAAMRIAHASDKPVVVAQNLSRTNRPDWLAELAARGLPVLDGTENALKAAGHWLRHRAFQRSVTADDPLSRPDAATVAQWRDRLARGGVLGESESLELFRDFGLSVPRSFKASNLAGLSASLRDVQFPVVAKTAMDGILHKSDVGGVILGIADAPALQAAYLDLAGRLGPKVLVAEMAPPGVELALGMTLDDQFGPLMLVASGGIFIEVMRDRQMVLPPIGPRAARVIIDRLRSRPLLDGVRGRPGVDVDSLAGFVSRFSVLVAELGDLVAEIDLNPLIAGEEGVVAVDGVIIPKG